MYIYKYKWKIDIYNKKDMEQKCLFCDGIVHKKCLCQEHYDAMQVMKNDFKSKQKDINDYNNHYHNLRYRIILQKNLEVVICQTNRLIALAEACREVHNDASLSEKVFAFAQKTMIRKKENLIANNIEYQKLKEQESEIDFRKMWAKDFITIDGHEVRSLSEAYIDYWLFSHNINHIYEKQIILKEATLICDFYLPDYDLYIEYWGKYDKKYVSRKQAKIRLYEENHINYLGIGLEEIKNLDFFLTKKIIKKPANKESRPK